MYVAVPCQRIQLRRCMVIYVVVNSVYADRDRIIRDTYISVRVMFSMTPMTFYEFSLQMAAVRWVSINVTILLFLGLVFHAEGWTIPAYLYKKIA